LLVLLLLLLLLLLCVELLAVGCPLISEHGNWRNVVICLVIVLVLVWVLPVLIRGLVGHGVERPGAVEG
jgi:hypothetical protein